MSAPGWYPDPGGGSGQQRYYDGSAWTSHVVTTLQIEQRQQILQRALVDIAGRDSRVVAQSPTSAVLSVGQPINHVAHLLASVFLCGLWLPVWAIISATGGEKRVVVSVDEHGQLHRST